MARMREYGSSLLGNRRNQIIGVLVLLVIGVAAIMPVAMPPSLSMDEDTVTAAPESTLSGVVRPTHASVEVSQDGGARWELVQVEPAGTFSHDIYLPREGENTVLVRASNRIKVLRSVSEVAMFYAPPVELVLHSSSAETLDAEIEITGRTEPGARVTANSREVKVEEDGSFTVRQGLSMGTSVIRVTASRPGHSESSEEFVAVRLTQQAWEHNLAADYVAQILSIEERVYSAAEYLLRMMDGEADWEGVSASVEQLQMCLDDFRAQEVPGPVELSNGKILDLANLEGAYGLTLEGLVSSAHEMERDLEQVFDGEGGAWGFQAWSLRRELSANVFLTNAGMHALVQDTLSALAAEFGLPPTRTFRINI